MGTARLGKLRLIGHVHEQAGADGPLGDPNHTAPYGQRTGGRGRGQSGFGQRCRAREVAHEARQRVGHGGQPGIGLFRQFRRANLGQQGRRQALEQGTRQSLGNQAECGVLVIAVLLVRRDAGQQPARSTAKQVVRSGLFHPVPEFDQEQVHGAPIDEPDTVRVVEPYRQVAGAGHRCTGAGGELAQRCKFRESVLHQPDFTSL